jgi:hypothetical protein
MEAREVDRKGRNQFLGGTRPPFGSRAGDYGELVPEEAEQAAIARSLGMFKGPQLVRPRTGKAFSSLSSALRWGSRNVALALSTALYSECNLY